MKNAAMIGYYAWNWGAGSFGPSNANIGVAFTGLVDVKDAVDQYTPGVAWCCPHLIGPNDKGFISIGGGNAAGQFTVSSLAAIAKDMHYIVESEQYSGVIFDVEILIGDSAPLIKGFNKVFKAAKKAGLQVGVTTSHSAPYQTDTPQVAIDVVKSWVTSDDIDFLSPQLYSSGMEGAPEFAETAGCAQAGCKWDLYKNAKPTFVPAIVDPTHYAPSQQYFASKYGIQTEGYF